MIQFALKCEQDHQFESWFGSGDDYDRLRASGHVSCPVCGSTKVTKSLMAPRVTPGRKKAAAPLSQPDTPAEAKLKELRKEIEKNSEYVGMNFASEARAIHDGDAPERSIYGEAKPQDAKKLIEDGVPVTPLPFMPGRKAN